MARSSLLAAAPIATALALWAPQAEAHLVVMPGNLVYAVCDTTVAHLNQVLRAQETVAELESHLAKGTKPTQETDVNPGMKQVVTMDPAVYLDTLPIQVRHFNHSGANIAVRDSSEELGRVNVKGWREAYLIGKYNARAFLNGVGKQFVRDGVRDLEHTDILKTTPDQATLQDLANTAKACIGAGAAGMPDDGEPTGAELRKAIADVRAIVEEFGKKR